MHSGFPALDDVSGRERRKILEPKTCCLYLAMTKLPRLYYLIRLSDSGGDDADGVFESYVVDGGMKECLNKFNSLFLLSLFFLEPPCTAHGQVCAGRMKYGNIPIFMQVLEKVSLYMRSLSLCRK